MPGRAVSEDVLSRGVVDVPAPAVKNEESAA
jgi:hypothetical protein